MSPRSTIVPYRSEGAEERKVKRLQEEKKWTRCHPLYVLALHVMIPIETFSHFTQRIHKD